MLLLVFQARLLSLLKIRGHVLRSLLPPPPPPFLWVPQSLESISIALQCFTEATNIKRLHTVVQVIKTLAFCLAFTPVFIGIFFHQNVGAQFLMYILLKRDLKCQKPVLNEVCTQSFTWRWSEHSWRVPSSPLSGVPNTPTTCQHTVRI